MSGSQTTKTVKVVVAGETSGARGELDKLSQKSQSTANGIKSHFANLGSAIKASGITGAFGEVLNTMSSMTDAFAEKSKNKFDAIGKIGVGVAGVGGGLMALSSAQVQAQAQLKTAISDTGGSYADFKDKIEETVKQQQNFGHTTTDTYNALQTLTSGTNDPAKALQYMAVTANLAAAKHESLADAATQVSKVLNGTGTRVLAQYGIQVQGAKQQAAGLAKEQRGVAASSAAVDAAMKASDSAGAAYISKITSIAQAHKTGKAAVAAVSAAMSDYETTLDSNGNATVSSAAAHKKLEDALTALGGKTGLTMTEQLALNGSLQKVTDTQVKLKGAYDKQDAAQKALTAGTGKHVDAIDLLSQRLNGQASASVSGFTGQMRVLGTKVQEQVSDFGAKYGPALAGVGAGMTVAAKLAQGAAAGIGKMSEALKGAGTATDALAASQDVAAVSADGLAVGETAADTAGMPLILTIGLIVLAVAAVIAIIYELVTHWHEVFETMKAIISDVVGFFKAHWELIAEILIAPFAPFLALFIRFHTQIIDGFKAVVGDAIGVWNGLVSFFESLPGRIESLAQGMFDPIGNAFKGVVNWIISLWDKIADATRVTLPSVSIPLVGNIGGGTIGPLLPHLDQFATGGIVHRPTLALIGESGPEAVIPLRRGDHGPNASPLPGGLGGGGGNVFHVEQNVHLPTGTPEQFARETTWRLGRLVS